MNFESSNKEALYVLRSKRELLETKIKEKIKELKATCLQEAELTGILPPDTPLEPGESLPKFRRKIPSAFCYQDNESSTLCNPRERDEATLFSLELECKEQKTIADVALGLANDEAATKSIRRKHRLIYQQSQKRLQELESRLTLIKQSVCGNNQLKHRKVAPQLSSDVDSGDNGDNNAAIFYSGHQVVRDRAHDSFRDKGRQRVFGLQTCNEDDNSVATFSGDRAMKDCGAYESIRGQIRQRKVASQICDEIDSSDKDSNGTEIICSGDRATKDCGAYNSFRNPIRQKKTMSQICDEVDGGDKGSDNENAAILRGSDQSMKDHNASDSFRNQMKRRNLASQTYDEVDSSDSCNNIAAMLRSGDQTLKNNGFYDSFGKSNRHNTLPSRSNPQSIPNRISNNFAKSSSQSVNQVCFGSPRSQRSLNFECSQGGEPASFGASCYSNQCYSSMTSCSAKDIKLQMMSRYGSLDRRYLKSRSGSNNFNVGFSQDQDNFRNHVFSSGNRDDCSSPHSSLSSLNSQKSGPTKVKPSKDIKDNNENYSVLLPNQTYPENTFARTHIADNLSCKSAESTDQLFTNNNNTLNRRTKEKEWIESSLDSPDIPIQKRNPTPPLQPRAATAPLRPPHNFPHPPPPLPPQHHHVLPLPRCSSPQGGNMTRYRQNDHHTSPLARRSSPQGDNISRYRQNDHQIAPVTRCSSPQSDNISRHLQNDHHILPLPRCPSPQGDNTSHHRQNDHHALLPLPRCLSPQGDSISRQRQNDHQTPPPICVSPVDLIENAVPIESPKNHTIVEVGKWQPYREVTKPFEMSDFYKYSTKFRKNSQNNNTRECDSAKLVPEKNNNDNKLEEKTFVQNYCENNNRNQIEPEFDAPENHRALNLQNVTDRKHRQKVCYQQTACDISK